MTGPTEYRNNVGAILRRPEDGFLLLGKRIDTAGVWQFPQGGVEPGESREDAVWRELSEELGLERPRDVCVMLGHGPPTRYDFAPGYDAPVARKYRGQEQTLFVFDFLGTDADFQLDRFEFPEFCDTRWLSVADTLRDFWPVKLAPFQAALRALPHVFGEIPT